ncbi:hypothetical protein OTU49_017433 [Cherax quadricarinatus]|uniref:mRNA export factor GLE1 n=2 Tax=Cherax quadricarinatus TaxID=27406 RepID=A0AAW0XGM1_CHEQU|nr:mRNA export factor Gle1-like [Cherax quadricarinatus]
MTEDPTSLKSVLSALSSSEKLKHWHKPPQDYGPDNPEDSDYNRNGLKDVGDLTSITISPGFSFGNANEDEDSKPLATEAEITHDAFAFTIDPSEELGEEYRCDSLILAKRAQEQYQIMQQLENMSLEEECKQEFQKRIKARYREYVSKLSEIHAEHNNKIQQYYQKRNEELAHEEYRLRQQQEDVIDAVKKCNHEYSQYVSERSSWLLGVVEDARRKEAEQADLRRALVNHLLNTKETYIVKLTQMHQLLREFEGTESLDSKTESLLNQTVTQVEDVLNNATQNTVTQKQLNEAQNSLQMGLSCVDTIIQTLNTKKEERAKLETERINQEAEEAKLKAAAQLEVEKQKALREEMEKLANEQIQEGGYDIVAMMAGKNRLEDFKSKVGNFLNTVDIMSQKYPEMRMEVHRATSVINQLNLTDNRVNREKLQKLISFLAGRDFGPGKATTDTDPVILEYAKNHVISSIIKFGTDRQKTGMGVYAWLLVNLILVFPEMWDLFLYHLYISCPYLIPIKPMQIVGQSEEDFNKTKGMKANEKSDAHIARMGTSATIYGIVLGMISKKREIPIAAPVIGWELLAKLLSLTPTSGVTAIILRNFLEAAGFSLQEAYGKQFLKLMDFLNNVYMNKIQEVTEGAGSQGLSVLQNFMEAFKTTHKIQQDKHVANFY